MRKQIFVINGSGGVGKDLFITYVSFNVYTHVGNFSSVDKVKKIAKEIGWDGGKTEKDRKFLSDLKLLCTEYNDMPFNSIRGEINDFLSDKHTGMLFIHIREPKEIARLVKEFKAKTILVKRDSVEHITSNMADENVFNYNYDIVINNNGTKKELKDKAVEFAKDYIEGKFKNEY